MKRLSLFAVSALSFAVPVWAESPRMLSFEPSTDALIEAEPVMLAEQPASTPAPAPQHIPCPIHTIEGYGGLAMVPTAYLVNPGPKGQIFGLPAISGTAIYIGHDKNLETLAITDTLWGRIELGYGMSRFGLGDGQDAIKKATGVEVRDDVYLHNLNARFMLVEENSFGWNWMPALTAGVHYKINEGVDDIDDKLGGALSKTGLESNQGVDFTFVGTKMFPELVFGRPLILSLGLRNSDAAWLGYLGFGDNRHTTFEGSVVVLATNWLAFCYEYRQKIDQYDRIPGLQDGEDGMHAMGFAIFPDSHMSIAVLYGIFGATLNGDEDNAVGVQVKWEF